MDWITPTIGAAATVGTQFINNKLGFDQTKRLSALQQGYTEKNMALENQYNMQNLQYQYEKNMEQWNAENAYNTPSAQMERYQSAGLNPNLVTGTSNNAATSPSYGMSDVSPHSASLPNSQPNIDLLSALQTLMSVKQQESNIEQSQAQTNYYNQLSEKVGSETIYQTFLNKQEEFKSLYYGKNAEYDSNAKKQSVDKMLQEIRDLTFKNETMNPLAKTFAEFQNQLSEQHLKFNEQMNPQLIQEITSRIALNNALRLTQGTQQKLNSSLSDYYKEMTGTKSIENKYLDTFLSDRNSLQELKKLHSEQINKIFTDGTKSTSDLMRLFLMLFGVGKQF